jgi:group II intron reverse transcriptase/maturase
MKQTHVRERVYEPGRRAKAWQQVRQKARAAGIDKMTVEEFERREDELLRFLHDKLKSRSYRFTPARRVLIPKEGSSKKRKVGIPVVMDRVVSQSINLVCEDIVDPAFSASNFGFRRGKSQHQAIQYVQEIVREGHDWCASIDLSNFFDERPHDHHLNLVRRNVADEGLVTLVARALKTGVVVDGAFEKTTKGCPQGSPLSPMLANIVLNELNQERERRGLRFCRWADDFVILLKSERAAHRVMAGTIRYLEECLRLPVNKEKSQATGIKEVTFLGFQLLRGKIRVSQTARIKFKRRVRELTRRNNPRSRDQGIQALTQYLRGWSSYFRIQEFRVLFRDLDAWIRSRVRSMPLKKWKNPRKFQRVLITAGFNPQEARRIWVR